MLNNLHNAVFLLALLPAAFANPVTASSTNSTVSLPEGHHSPSFHGHHGGSHSHHAARGVTGKLHCGNFANANGQMAGNLVSALNAGSLKTHEYSVAAHGCNRVNCWDTSGVYVCNVSLSPPPPPPPSLLHPYNLILNSQNKNKNHQKNHETNPFLLKFSK